MLVRSYLAVFLVLSLCACGGGRGEPQGGVYRACIMSADRVSDKFGVAGRPNSYFASNAMGYEYDYDRKCYVREWVFPAGLHHNLLRNPQSTDVVFDVKYQDESPDGVTIGVRISPYMGWNDFNGRVNGVGNSLTFVGRANVGDESPCMPWMELHKNKNLCYSEMLSEPDLYIYGAFIRGRNGSVSYVFNEFYAKIDDIYYVKYSVASRNMPEYRDINDHIVSLVRSYLSVNPGG